MRPMRLEPGAHFDRFTVEALLGEGGMGQVYRAYDARLARRVALKILRTRAGDEGGPAQQADRVALILREARAAAALDHPNAVSIFELGEHDGIPFMAMELISGLPLRALIGSADVPLEQRVIWLLDVARVLEAAHRAGIVHLDIKPENVMVRSDGVVKVLDFGIARRADFVPDPADATSWENARSTALTQGSALVGDLALHLAPEQVHRQQVDGRTDQFAWGVVAYELCTGSLPWPTNGTAFDLLSAILTKAPPPLSKAVPDLPPAVSAVVMRALEKAPEDRFAGMGDIVGALGAALGGAVTTRGARALPISMAPPDEEARRALAHMLTESSHVSDDLLVRVRALAAAGTSTGSNITPGPLSIELTEPQKEALAAMSTAPVVSDPPMPPIAMRATQRSADSRPSAGARPPSDLPAAQPAVISVSAGAGSGSARSRDKSRGPATEDLPHECAASPLTPALPSSTGRPLSAPPEGPGAQTRKSPGASGISGPPSERVRVETREGASYPGLVPEMRRSSVPPSEPARPGEPAAGAQGQRKRRFPIEIAGTTLAVVAALGLLIWGRAPGDDAARGAFRLRGALGEPHRPDAHHRAAHAHRLQPRRARGVQDGDPGPARRHLGAGAPELRARGRRRRSLRRGAAQAGDDRPGPRHRVGGAQGVRAGGGAPHPAQRSRSGHPRRPRSDRAQRPRELPRVPREARRDRAALAGRRGDRLPRRGSGRRSGALAREREARARDRSELLGRLADQGPRAGRDGEDPPEGARGARAVPDGGAELGRLRPRAHHAPAEDGAVRGDGQGRPHLERARPGHGVRVPDARGGAGVRRRAARGGERGAPPALAEARRGQARPARDLRGGRAARRRWGETSRPRGSGRGPSRTSWTPDANYEPHVRPAFVQLGLLAETGQPDQAALVAAEFLKRKAAWSSTLTPDSLDVALYSFEPRLLTAARRGGPSPMTTAAFTAARDAWAAATEDAGILHKEVLWADGFAMPVETAAEAGTALASMPPRLLASEGYLHAPAEISGAFVGHALLLAGRVDEAVAFLRVATRSCFALDDPFVHTRAFLWLGEALEQQKDKDGACAAYARVEDRWGKARPRSMTAAEAQRRALALKCPR